MHFSLFCVTKVSISRARSCVVIGYWGRRTNIFTTICLLPSNLWHKRNGKKKVKKLKLYLSLRLSICRKYGLSQFILAWFGFNGVAPNLHFPHFHQTQIYKTHIYTNSNIHSSDLHTPKFTQPHIGKPKFTQLKFTPNWT